MSNITVGRILLLDLVFLVNSALTLVVFKFVCLLDVMTTPALFFHYPGIFHVLDLSADSGRPGKQRRR